VATSVAVLSTQAVPNGSATQDAQLLAELSKLWASHHRRSLAIRLETGSRLNARLGEPTIRQEHGEAILKQAAKELHVAESDLNRMRWFALFSKDEESCWGDIPPSSRTWTKFKERLPDLIAARKGNEKRKRNSGDRKKPAPSGGISKWIGSLTDMLLAADVTVDGEDQSELIERLQAFVSAVSEVTGIRIHLDTDKDAVTGPGQSTPPALIGCESSPVPSQAIDNVTV